MFTSEQFEQGLESWRWIGLEGKVPVIASLFGDVIFQAADGFWWLDSLQGTLTRSWADADALLAELNTEDGQEHYLLASLAQAAGQRGLTLAAGQMYDFTRPPVLGGEVGADNLQVIDFVVGLNIAGQIHQQVRALPPGSPISGITMS
ncbi:T6SS immunity protein Tdi1 domain-containing protein [Nonomuraea sp. NPDC052265]|uniref:T6SS immunity protein Tdi1 domain-containing protein n=1 Tax=Nonomuraea sp. NPDC052265 TaxID=3364374 RepID=UPI0037CBF4A2